MSISYGGDNITFPDGSTQNTSPQTGFVNRIINGDMRIDQRNAGASVTVPNTNSTATWSVDRWEMLSTQASKFSVQQNAGSVTPPIGFTNYLGTTSLSAYSILSGDAFAVEQFIEGFNVADLGWGTVNAQTITLSFWVRSSLTGTFGGALRNSGNNRSYTFSYTISASNTWEQKLITIIGDTTGTWLTNNGIGLAVSLGIGVGSTFSSTAGSWSAGQFYSTTGATSVVGTSGATFYITGVQLEKGSTATPFEFRSIGQELALCQRYYQVVAFVGTAVTTGEMGATGVFKVTMRTPPSLNSALRHPPSYNSSNNQIVSYGVGPVNVGSAAFSSVSADFFGAILCTGLAVGAVYGGSTTASAEL